MRTPTLEPAPTRSKQLADHTSEAMAMAYVRYLMDRTGRRGADICEAYFRQTGNVPEGNPRDFRRWAGQRVFVMDQLGQNPFAEDAA